ncbi:MAG TPA: glycosyltransferase family 4 protein [Vicinamibacterales bacterium]|nr:glycosyltransferase family 4 protein [Vicinamibacterales bacterium]
MTRRLLTVGHSYVVAQNRRLAHEMALAAGGRWEITVGAPERLREDLHESVLIAGADEPCRVCPLGLRLASSRHLRVFDGRLRRLMAGRWDVVHAWQEPYVAAGAQIAAAAPAGARLVFASFQNISKRYPPPLRSFEQRTLTRADGWIAFGETVHETLISRRGYDRKPSRVIPPGVDVGIFRPDSGARAAVRARFGWSHRDLVVGYLGRFVPEKGIGTIIQALAKVPRAWKALFVGRGPLESELRRFAASHPGRVQVLTGVDHEAVPAHLCAMDVLCAPSRTTPRWREQFGRMLIEAMACGVPVIASRSGEIPFVVGDAGVLVAEADVSGWSHAIAELLGDQQIRRDRKARGLDRVHARFAWPVVARAHLAFFEDLLARAEPQEGAPCG